MCGVGAQKQEGVKLIKSKLFTPAIVPSTCILQSYVHYRASKDPVLSYAQDSVLSCAQQEDSAFAATAAAENLSNENVVGEAEDGPVEAVPVQLSPSLYPTKVEQSPASTTEPTMHMLGVPVLCSHVYDDCSTGELVIGCSTTPTCTVGIKQSSLQCVQLTSTLTNDRNESEQSDCFQVASMDGSNIVRETVSVHDDCKLPNVLPGKVFSFLNCRPAFKPLDNNTPCTEGKLSSQEVQPGASESIPQEIYLLHELATLKYGSVKTTSTDSVIVILKDASTTAHIVPNNSSLVAINSCSKAQVLEQAVAFLLNCQVEFCELLEENFWGFIQLILSQGNCCYSDGSGIVWSGNVCLLLLSNNGYVVVACVATGCFLNTTSCRFRSIKNSCDTYPQASNKIASNSEVLYHISTFLNSYTSRNTHVTLPKNLGTSRTVQNSCVNERGFANNHMSFSFLCQGLPFFSELFLHNFRTIVDFLLNLCIGNFNSHVFARPEIFVALCYRLDTKTSHLNTSSLLYCTSLISTECRVIQLIPSSLLATYHHPFYNTKKDDTPVSTLTEPTQTYINSYTSRIVPKLDYCVKTDIKLSQVSHIDKGRGSLLSQHRPLLDGDMLMLVSDNLGYVYCIFSEETDRVVCNNDSGTHITLMINIKHISDLKMPASASLFSNNGIVRDFRMHLRNASSNLLAVENVLVFDMSLCQCLLDYLIQQCTQKLDAYSVKTSDHRKVHRLLPWLQKYKDRLSPPPGEQIIQHGKMSAKVSDSSLTCGDQGNNCNGQSKSSSSDKQSSGGSCQSFCSQQGTGGRGCSRKSGSGSGDDGDDEEHKPKPPDLPKDCIFNPNEIPKPVPKRTKKWCRKKDTQAVRLKCKETRTTHLLMRKYLSTKNNVIVGNELNAIDHVNQTVSSRNQVYGKCCCLYELSLTRALDGANAELTISESSNVLLPAEYNQGHITVIVSALILNQNFHIKLQIQVPHIDKGRGSVLSQYGTFSGISSCRGGGDMVDFVLRIPGYVLCTLSDHDSSVNGTLADLLKLIKYLIWLSLKIFFSISVSSHSIFTIFPDKVNNNSLTGNSIPMLELVLSFKPDKLFFYMLPLGHYIQELRVYCPDHRKVGRLRCDSCVCSEHPTPKDLVKKNFLDGGPTRASTYSHPTTCSSSDEQNNCKSLIFSKQSDHANSSQSHSQQNGVCGSCSGSGGSDSGSNEAEKNVVDDKTPLQDEAGTSVLSGQPQSCCSEYALPQVKRAPPWSSGLQRATSMEHMSICSIVNSCHSFTIYSTAADNDDNNSGISEFYIPHAPHQSIPNSIGGGRNNTCSNSEHMSSSLVVASYSSFTMYPAVVDSDDNNYFSGAPHQRKPISNSFGGGRKDLFCHCKSDTSTMLTETQYSSNQNQKFNASLLVVGISGRKKGCTKPTMSLFRGGSKEGKSSQEEQDSSEENSQDSLPGTQPPKQSRQNEQIQSREGATKLPPTASFHLPNNKAETEEGKSGVSVLVTLHSKCKVSNVNSTHVDEQWSLPEQQSNEPQHFHEVIAPQPHDDLNTAYATPIKEGDCTPQQGTHPHAGQTSTLPEIFKFFQETVGGVNEMFTVEKSFHPTETQSECLVPPPDIDPQSSSADSSSQSSEEYYSARSEFSEVVSKPPNSYSDDSEDENGDICRGIGLGTSNSAPRPSGKNSPANDTQKSRSPTPSNTNSTSGYASQQHSMSLDRRSRHETAEPPANAAMVTSVTPSQVLAASTTLMAASSVASSVMQNSTSACQMSTVSPLKVDKSEVCVQKYSYSDNGGPLFTKICPSGTNLIISPQELNCSDDSESEGEGLLTPEKHIADFEHTSAEPKLEHLTEIFQLFHYLAKKEIACLITETSTQSTSNEGIPSDNILRQEESPIVCKKLSPKLFLCSYEPHISLPMAMHPPVAQSTTDQVSEDTSSDLCSYKHVERWMVSQQCSLAVPLQDVCTHPNGAEANSDDLQVISNNENRRHKHKPDFHHEPIGMNHPTVNSSSSFGPPSISTHPFTLCQGNTTQPVSPVHPHELQDPGTSITRGIKRRNSVSHFPGDQLTPSPLVVKVEKQRKRSSSLDFPTVFENEVALDFTIHKSPLQDLEVPVVSTLPRNLAESDSNSLASNDEYRSGIEFNSGESDEELNANFINTQQLSKPTKNVVTSEFCSPENIPHAETIPGYLLSQELALMHPPLPKVLPYWAKFLYSLSVHQIDKASDHDTMPFLNQLASADSVPSNVPTPFLNQFSDHHEIFKVQIK